MHITFFHVQVTLPRSLCFSLLKRFSAVVGENPVESFLQTEDIISSCIYELAEQLEGWHMQAATEEKGLSNW